MNSHSKARTQGAPRREAAAEPEADRRRQFIAVTIDCLAELGYVRTTLAQIAARAGVSPGLVAHYFGDKDALYLAVLEWVYEEIRAQERDEPFGDHGPSTFKG